MKTHTMTDEIENDPVPPPVPDQTEAIEDDLDAMLKDFNKGKTIKITSESPSQTETPPETVPGENPPDQPKGKRGRKPGSRNKPAPGPDDGTVMIDSSLISGALALSFIDFLLPELMAAGHNWLRKKDKRINAEDLRLSEDQNKRISPIADKVIDQLKIRMSPLAIFALTMFGIYFVNFAVAKGKAE